MRHFSVIAHKEGMKRAVRYPARDSLPMEGAKAMALMERLASRGFITWADTLANGEKERLTLAEMRASVI